MGSRRLINVVTASVILFVGITEVQGHPAPATTKSRATWPHPATKANVIRKIGIKHWRKAIRVGICETGLTVNWHLTGKYRGALGMYVHTFAYGKRATGYAGRTLPEQVGIAVASFPITRGWSGWGCGGA